MTTYRVRVYITKRGGTDLAGLFDMLRYDQAQVLTWDHVSEQLSPIGEHYTLTLKSERVTIDRWASFGLVVTDIKEVRS